MFKGILLDLDGTLADSLESLAVSGNKGLEKVGLPVQPQESYKEFAGDGPHTLVKRALAAAGDTEYKNYDVVLETYEKELNNFNDFSLRTFDGMKEALDKIKSHNGLLIVITNKPQKSAQKVVDRLFGNGYFDLVVGFSDEFPKKPNPESTLYAMNKFNLSPNECMYVGDTNVDMQTGKGAGAYTVGVLWGFRDRKELEENNADIIISHPMELVDIFTQKNNL